MELYLDTANVAEVERLARIFPIAGVTTNPSIIAASKESICNQVNHLIPTRVLVKGGEITCKILK